MIRDDDLDDWFARQAYEEHRLDAEAAAQPPSGGEWAICPTCQGNGCGECGGSGEVAAEESEP